MSEDRKPFTVKDRRHFTPEGEARAEEPESPPAGEDAPEPPRAGAPGPEAPRTAPSGPPTIDFLTFVLSLAAQSGELLSDAEGGPHLQDARQTIGILEMLQEKAQSGFTDREKDALSQVLYELHMAYVAASRKATP